MELGSRYLACSNAVIVDRKEYRLLGYFKVDACAPSTDASRGIGCDHDRKWDQKRKET